MFPLGTVLFPGQALPLVVFEPRYRTMTRECLAGDRRFGVVLIERGHEVGGGDTRVHTGTVAEIAEVEEVPDGRFFLITVGQARVRVLEWLPDDPYPQAMVETLPEPEPGPPGQTADATLEARLQAAERAVRRALALVAELGINPGATTGPAVVDDPNRALWQLCAQAPVGAYDRQRLLEAPTTAERAALLEEVATDAADLFALRLAEGP
jgi:Lon protease-like protein